jgi:hypothetical protein
LLLSFAFGSFQAFILYISCLLAYPEIENININYRPELSDHEQAQIDLKRFVQKCKKWTISLNSKISDMEKAGKQKLNERSADEDYTFTKKPVTAKKNASVRCGSGEKSIGESTAKPRSLLPLFLQANDKTVSKLECRLSNHGHSIVVAEDLNPASAKKVRWHRDCDDSDDLENVEYGTQTAVEMVKGSAKRKAFGLNALGGRNDLRGTKAKDRGAPSRSSLVDCASLSILKKEIADEPISDNRFRVEDELWSEPFSKSDSKRRRVSSAVRTKEAVCTDRKSRNITGELSSTVSKTEQKSFKKSHSNHEEPNLKAKRWTIDETAGDAVETTKTEQVIRKMLSSSSNRDESKTQKKRVSSAQFSGISSQERPSKGRRRKRVLSGASVGSKPGRSDFVEEEYSFNFTN